MSNKTAFQSKANHRRTQHIDTLFCSCGLDLDLMTFIYELYLVILQMYLHTKYEHCSWSRHSTFTARTEQTSFFASATLTLTRLDIPT